MSLIKSFSVGNGDMFYINHNSDNFTTIDCCLDYDESSKAAKEHVLNEIERESSGKGITRFISTHPDEDHISGIKEFYNRIGIINFYRVDNNATKSSEESEDFKKYKQLRDDEYKKVSLYKGCTRKWMNIPDNERGSSGLFCLWPIVNNAKYQKALKEAADGGSPNNISPAIKYKCDDFSFLWMGDMETEMQEEFDKQVKNSQVNVVFANNHGGK